MRRTVLAKGTTRCAVLRSIQKSFLKILMSAAIASSLWVNVLRDELAAEERMGPVCRRHTTSRIAAERRDTTMTLSGSLAVSLKCRGTVDRAESMRRSSSRDQL